MAAPKKRESRKSMKQPAWITLDGGFALTWNTSEFDASQSTYVGRTWFQRFTGQSIR